MSQEETSLLRAEIARLNRLLEALLTANEALRREISLVKGAGGLPGQPYSIEQRTDGITSSQNSIDTRTDGTTLSNGSIEQRMDGINTTQNSIATRTDGTTSPNNSIATTIDGITSDLTKLPEKMELNGNHILYIRHDLSIRTGAYIKVSDTCLENHTKMLINFYNGGSGSHKELRKITGLSKGGMAKSIMSLTKRGLITRTGFQKFSLTGEALKILEAGWQNFSKYTYPTPTATNS